MEINHNRVNLTFNESTGETRAVVKLKDGQEIEIKSELELLEAIPLIERILLDRLLELYAV